MLSSYQYRIEYRSTSVHVNADGLSRLPIVGDAKKDDEWQGGTDAAVFNLAQIYSLAVTVEKLKVTTARDPELSKVLLCTRNGWPVSASEGLQSYWKRKDELSVEGGCLLWGICVIVPPKLQRQVLDELHQGHPGASRMKALARSCVWWPGLDKDLERLAKSCISCQSVEWGPQTAPLHPWVWPSRPWQRVHIDFAGPIGGHTYLVLVDAHSKWPEVIDIPSTTAARTIEALRSIFASYGLPLQLVSDNGPQFSSA